MNVIEAGELVMKHKSLSLSLRDLQTALHQMSAENNYAEAVSCSIKVRQGVNPPTAQVDCSMDVARPFFEAEAAKVEQEIQEINHRFEKVA